MKALRTVVEQAYNHLHQHNLVKSQYQFSRDWLKKDQSYYGYLKSSGADTTPHVVLNLWAECRRQRMSWQRAANDNDRSQASKAVFSRLAENSEQMEKFVSEAMKAKYF